MQEKKGTLVIVPGWMHNSSHWAQAAVQLPEWDVHIIDLPGFGIEPLVSDTWGVPEYARFAIENIKYTIEKIEPGQKLVILGHSFGGRILAHIFGNRETHNSASAELCASTDRLILYAAPCLYRPSMKVQVKNFLARTARRAGIAKLLPDRLKPYDLRQATDAGLGAIFKRSVPYSQDDALRNIAVPTTLLWGSADTSVPVRIAEEMHTVIKNSQLETLPNEGHNIHLDNPGLFYGTLRRVLGGV